MKRILIVNVNWRGDVLFSTPFIRAIREKYPQSYLACLVVPRCAPILENNPHLNELIVFEEKGRHRGLVGKLRLIWLLRRQHFDTAFLLHRSFTRALICLLAGIPERIGYYTRKRAGLLTKCIPVPAEKQHKIEYFLNIARACGIAARNKDYEFYPTEADQGYAHRLLQENAFRQEDFLVVVNPGGNWDLKRWPKERFAELCDQLIERCQAKVIITGALKDVGLAQDIAARMKNHPLILCGKTSLGELAALMAKVDLVIANDSGPMHIAASQGTRVIALFGPTSPEITGPYGRGDYLVLKKDVGCAVPCYKLDCSDQRCMQAITVEDVLEAAKKLKL